MYEYLDSGGCPDPHGQSYTHVLDDGSTQEVWVSKEVLDDRFWPAVRAVESLMERHVIDEYDLELNYAHTKTAGPEVFGTLDFVGRSALGHVVIADFKFGQGIRESARENEQLAFYTVGLHDNDDQLIRGAQKYVFAIIQPWRDETDIVDEWETDMWWLESFRQLERKAYLRIVNNETSFKAGDWCKFCRGKVICPEYQQTMEAFIHKTPPKDVMPSSMTPYRLAELLDMGERAVELYNALVEFATKYADDPSVVIPGWKFIESVGHRRYKDSEIAAKRAASLVGSEAFKPRELKTPAQLEKVFKKLGENFDEMNDLIERPNRGPRLVRDTHKAPSRTSASDVELPFNVVPLKGNKKS